MKISRQLLQTLAFCCKIIRVSKRADSPGVEHSAKTRRRWRFSRLPERSGRRASFPPGSSIHYRSPFFGELAIFFPFFPRFWTFSEIPARFRPLPRLPSETGKNAKKPPVPERNRRLFLNFGENPGKRPRPPLRRPLASPSGRGGRAQRGRRGSAVTMPKDGPSKWLQDPLSHLR